MIKSAYKQLRQLRQHRLRTAEIVAVTTTAAAFAVTILLVSTSAAPELNPSVLALLDNGGWAAAGVGAVGFEAAAFWCLRKHHGKDARDLSLFSWAFGTVHVGRLVRRTAWAIAAIGISGLAINVYWLGQARLSELVHFSGYAPPVALVAGSAALVLAWPVLQRLPGPSPEVAGAVAFAVVLLIGTPGVAATSLSTTSTTTNTALTSAAAAGGAGTVLADAEEGDLSDWSTSSTDWSAESGSAIEGTYWANRSATSNSNQELIYSGFSSATPDSVSIVYNITKRHDSGFETRLGGYDSNDNKAFNIEISNDGSVYVNSIDLGGTDTGSDLSLETNYLLRFKNIDWSNDKFTLEISEYDSGTTVLEKEYNFDQSVNSIDRLRLVTGQGGSAYTDYWRKNAVGTGSSDLSGTVEDQDGTAVPNADVVLLAEYENNTGDRLTEVREELQSIEPEQFDKDLSLTGSDSHFESVDGEYAVAHSASEWELGGTTYPGDDALGELNADPDLSHPNTVYTTDEELILHIRDAGNRPFAQDNVDEDLPGTTTSGEVVVRKLDASGDPIHEFSPNTSDFVETGFGWGSIAGRTHEAVRIGELSTGFYEVYPESNPQASYVFAVAPNGKLSNMDQQPWVQDLKTTEGNLEERANELADLTNQSGIAIHHTKADSEGKWNYSFSGNVREVDIMAMKKPSTMDTSDYSGDYATYGEITSYLDSTIKNAREASLDAGESLTDDPRDVVCDGAAEDTGTVYLADGRVTAEPVETNITVPTRSASATPDVAPLNRLCMEQDLRDLLNELALSDLLPTLDIASMSTDELRNWLTDIHNGIFKESEEACERYLSAAGASDLSECEGGLSDDNDDGQYGGGYGSGDTPISTDPTSWGTGTTTAATEAAEEALDNTQDTVEDGSLDPTGGSGENVSFTYDTGLEDVSPDQVSVRIRYSNGSTTVTTANQSEHIRVESPAIGSDRVVIEDYPLGDANNAQFTVDVITADGAASATEQVRNPAFDGEIPGLQAVRISSTAPGPSDRVVVEAIADDTRPFDEIVDMRVEDPNGNELNRSNITDGQAAFTTNGSGVHRVELVLQRNGNNFTEVVTVGARDTPVKRPPTIRPAEGVTGTFAIVSDGFESGDMKVRNAGQSLVVVGQIATDADVPRRVHVHTQAIDLAKTHETTVKVVRGDDQRAVQSRTTNTLHEPPISADGIIYREDGDPIPRDGGNQFGDGEIDPVNGTTVETFSEADGSVVVELRNDPGFAAETWYEAKLRFPILADPPIVGQAAPVTPDLPSPDLPITPAGPMLLLGAGLLGRRWSA